MPNRVTALEDQAQQLLERSPLVSGGGKVKLAPINSGNSDYGGVGSQAMLAGMNRPSNASTT